MTVPELPAELPHRAPVALDGAEVDFDLVLGVDKELLDLYAGGRADAEPRARARFIPPPEPDIHVSSTTFALSVDPTGR